MSPHPRWLVRAAAVLSLLSIASFFGRSATSHQQQREKQQQQRQLDGITGDAAVVKPLSYGKLRGAATPRAVSAFPASSANRTLVLYVYHESSEHYVENLRFFVRMAIEASSSPASDDDVDYLLIVNGESRLLGELTELAARRGNVQVLSRPNTCFDGGAAGEALRTHPELLAAGYRYFVIMNSSVRGPFLPRFYPQDQPWTRALTGLLSDQVKLAGTTINCGGTGVHVQSMVLATDQEGLGILLRNRVLDCAANLQDAIKRYEIAATTAILDAG